MQIMNLELFYKIHRTYLGISIKFYYSAKP